MDEYRGPRFEGLGATMKRQRSQMSRRPRPQTQWFTQIHDHLFSSSFPLSDDANKVSSDENTGDVNSKEKMFSLNHCLSRGSSVSRTENDYPYKRTKKEVGRSGVPNDNGDVVDGNNTPSNHLGITVDGAGNENKYKKVKLKVGGVTRTIQTKSSSNGASGGGSSTKIARSSDASRSRQKRLNQGNSDRDHFPSPDKKSGLLGISRKDFAKGGFGHGKEDMSKMHAKNTFEKQGEKSDPVRKSKRVPKKRVLDGASDDEDDDDEIRYLEKLKSYKASGYKGFEEESSKKQHSLSRSKYENVEDVGRSGKDGRTCRSDRGSEDTEYEGEEELLSECEPEGMKKKKQKKDPSDSPAEITREKTLTTRQRALLSSKDASSASGGSQIEFPNGLPPPPPRKQKEKLSEVEQQLKKAEAAQRRRMQNEKVARESEAEAIKKILGQDASRKKREEQKKKRQEELAQEKAANAQMLAGNTIRWVMGPTGTVVTFPQEMGLPKIFEPKSCTYPPPREKCAGPSCANPYKYRDSKSKLPLCSLQCYKAIHERRDAETAS